jgi:hypothetical protein
VVCLVSSHLDLAPLHAGLFLASSLTWSTEANRPRAGGSRARRCRGHFSISAETLPQRGSHVEAERASHKGALALCWSAKLEGPIMRTILLLLFGALCSCATAPSPQSLDARALCQQLAQASASSPEQRSEAYFDQCIGTCQRF